MTRNISFRERIVALHGVVLHRMWVDESEFRFGNPAQAPDSFRRLFPEVPRGDAWGGDDGEGKPLDALALRRRFGDQLPCTSSDRIM